MNNPFSSKKSDLTADGLYRLGEQLRKGAHGTVFKCNSVATGEAFACKVFEDGQVLLAESEIQIHSRLDHPNIVRHERSQKNAGSAYIVMELCPDGSLENLVRKRRLREDEAALYFKQVALAVQYLHKDGILRRDLKLENILLHGQMVAKLCDFGLAAKLDYEYQLRGTFCGTPYYVAPEMGGFYCHTVDIWALGVILFTMLCGEQPFEGRTCTAIYDRIVRLDYRFPREISRDVQCRSFLKSLLLIFSFTYF